MKRPNDLPKVGMHYNCYDDGKVSYDRCYDVEVTDIIPFSRAVDSVLDHWDAACRSADGFFADDTDYFVKGISFECLDSPEEILFARTCHGDWFGMGRYVYDIFGSPSINDWYCSGLLDLDGHLTKELEAYGHC